MTDSRGELAVAIIGLGSRGLSVLERVITLAKLAGSGIGTVRVEVIDPRCDGAGVHTVDQPDYLLLNTTASQVSMFPDELSVGAAVDAPGPSLYDWVTERGLRLAADGFTVGPAGEREIRECEFLPRRVLGEYLGWFLEELLRRAPSYVSVTMHRAQATDTVEHDGGLRVVLSTGAAVDVDQVFLTTGYTAGAEESARPERLIGSPYPLPAAVAAVRPGETVAIGGFGLSAMDVMSALTVGRGGRFVAGDGGLRYLPSGDEPRMLFFSRSGVPCRARPEVVEFGPPYRPAIFTEAAIDAARAAPGGPVDFDTDVLPLVLAEIRVGYRRCAAFLAGQPDPFEDLEPAQVRSLLDKLDAERGRFDAAAAFDGSADMLLDDGDAYRKWLTEVLRADLADGLLGFVRSPVKAGLDTLRALRDMFRYVVDYGGLTGPSLDRFLGVTVPAINRAVVGPQYERHVELLALMAAGTADAPFGPAPRVTWSADGRPVITSTALAVPHEEQADRLIAAHVPMPAVSGEPVLAAMSEHGLLRRHQPISPQVPGLDLDSGHHPTDAGGQPDPRIRALGPLCEGATFYNNLVPSPAMFSRPLFDAHRLVTDMYAEAGVPMPSTAPPGRPCHPIHRRV